MNRKQHAIERKFLKQKNAPGVSFHEDVVKSTLSRLKAEYIENNRECTEADLRKYLESQSELDILGYWSLYGFTGCRWKEEAADIFTKVRKEANKNYTHNPHTTWHEFLLSYAVREYRYRNSKLAKALK